MMRLRSSLARCPEIPCIALMDTKYMRPMVPKYCQEKETENLPLTSEQEHHEHPISSSVRPHSKTALTTPIASWRGGRHHRSRPRQFRTRGHFDRQRSDR